MIKVLDLFAGTQSVRKAMELTDIQFEYIGVDIYSPEEENVILDLTQDNIVEKLKEKLPKGWKPDFIWASPVCNKFSTAAAATGGNLFFEIDYDTETIKPRTNFGKGVSMNPHYKKPENYQRYTNEAKQALILHKRTKEIIEYFNVPFALENPRRALSRFLYKDLIKNYTSYCMYGYDYQKPTTIYSNIEIKLKNCNHKNKRESHKIMLSGGKKDYTNGRKDMSGYSKRSKVPPLLIKDIFTQLMRKEQNEDTTRPSRP